MSSRPNMWLASAIAALTIIIGTACSSGDAVDKPGVSTSPEAAASKDVVIKKCERSAYGFKAVLEITNSTKSNASYIATVEAVATIDGKARRLGEGTAVVNDLRPKQVTSTDAIGGVEGDTKVIECKLVTVTRS